MIKKKEEILADISTILGDNSDDSALELIENISDTLDDYESRTADQTNWKTRYEENDAEWRQKYRDRFLNTGGKDEEDDPAPPEKPKKLRFSDLFKEE